MKFNYEKDDKRFNADAYTIAGYKGIAWYILGWELQDNEDTAWTGYQEKTGNIVAVMVGDDRYFVFDPALVNPLKRSSYCGSCGQIGCKHG